MNANEAQATDKDGAAEKLIVAMTGFAFSCLTFIVALFLLLPITGSLAEAIGAPGFLTVAAVCTELFVLPVLAAIWGVSFGVRHFVR